ncbi:hypothetical protein Tco_1174501 [Tanacetum coccineum]
MVKLMTFTLMCKAYGGEPSVDFLRSFLNLGPAGDWLTLSNREMDFRSFMIEGVDGEFNFLPKEGSTPSIKSVNNEAPVIQAELITAINPSRLIEDIDNSDDAPFDQDDVAVVDHYNPQNPKVGTSFKAVGKRKQVYESASEEPRQKARKVPPQASKTLGVASEPLDVDSNPDIDEFPAAKELKEAADCHFVVAHVTPPS